MEREFKGAIYMVERVVNKDRKFGEACSYIPAIVHYEDGVTATAAFTDADIAAALARAKKNKEDFPDEVETPKKKGLFSWLTGR